MNLSSVFITRPVTTTLLILGTLVFGTLAYQDLPDALRPAPLKEANPLGLARLVNGKLTLP